VSSTGPPPRLPPLNALRIFEMASHLGSLTKTAQALRITQSAVSRQIALLEEHLGHALFSRERYGVRLTEAGAIFAREIAPAFASIAAAAERMSVTGGHQPVQLRCTNVFAVKWLIPRLPRFQASHPRILIRVSQAQDLPDFEAEGCDLAVQYGDGHWPGLNRRRLIGDVLQPVCSPRLLREHPSLRSVGGLRHTPLLRTRLRPNDWPDWLAAYGPGGPTGPIMEFPSLLMTYQAAMEGLGVAIAHLPLLRQDIARGALVPLFNAPLPRPLGWYMAWPKGRRRSTRLQAFIDWLQSEAAEDSG
jgi:LysR family glycine cleavage system transcriptional activator